MKLKLYLFLLAFISLNFANATYFIQVTNIDPLTGAATYMLNETSSPLQLPISFCAFGSSQPQIATNYKISWYKNTTNSTTNGVLISEMVVSTLSQVNVQDFKTHLPDTSIAGTYYYYAILSEPSSTGCGMTDSLTSTTQKVEVFNPATHLNFDGVDDKVELSNESNFDFTTSFSMECWIKVSSFTEEWQTVISKGMQGPRIHRYPNTDFIAFGTGPADDLLSIVSVNDGNWHHIAATFDNGIKKLYVDGVLQGTQTVGLPLAVNDDPVLIGSQSDFYNPVRAFHGDIDEVRIWNFSKTEEQINSSKNCELQGNEVGLVAYYNFNQGIHAEDNTAVTTLTDASVYSNNGVLTNVALIGTSSNWMSGSPVITGSIMPTLPTVTSPIVYIEGETASELTATTGGTGLMWFTTETGGAGDVNAPTPNTDTVGSTSYWVASSNNNGCESERVEIVVTVEETLGVNDNVMIKGIAIYPNPTHGLLTINNNKGIDVQVTIYDINGRLLVSKSNNDTMTTLDITNFSNGIYLLRIQTELGDFTKKVIKN